MPASYLNFMEFYKESQNKGEVLQRIVTLTAISGSIAYAAHFMLAVPEIFIDSNPIFTAFIMLLSLFTLFAFFIFPCLFVLFLAYSFIGNLLNIIEKSWLCIALASIFFAGIECLMGYFMIENNWFIDGLRLKIKLDIFLQYYLRYEHVAIFAAANFLPRLIMRELRPGALLLKPGVHSPN
jgi:hypothetical protein